MLVAHALLRAVSPLLATLLKRPKVVKEPAVAATTGNIQVTTPGGTLLRHVQTPITLDVELPNGRRNHPQIITDRRIHLFGSLDCA